VVLVGQLARLEALLLLDRTLVRMVVVGALPTMALMPTITDLVVAVVGRQALVGLEQ
jgi:hypothetical protein